MSLHKVALLPKNGKLIRDLAADKTIVIRIKAYLEPRGTSTMELFSEIVIDF